MKKITALIVISLLSMAFMLLSAGQAMAEVQGVDVSRWQGTIDWDTVNQNTGFAIIKAGGSDEGMYADREFNRNQVEARRVGIAHGYYYYAGGGDPVQEAEHFASLVGELEPGELLALDFEVDHPDPVAYAMLFLVRTEELTGAKPLFYTNMNRVWKYDWKPVVDNGNHLWGAIYDGEPQVFPDPGAWEALAIKQFTSKATVPGINSDSVDMNTLPGAIEDFRALGKPFPVPPVPDKLDVIVSKPAVPETVLPDEQASSWDTEIQVAEEVDPNRLVGFVPVDDGKDHKADILTLKLPARRPVVHQTTFEMDFAAALDS